MGPLRVNLGRFIVPALFAGLVLSACRNQPTAPPAVSSAPRTGAFLDTAGEAGLRFTSSSSATPDHRFAEITGSGCALFDYNRDGWMDVLLLDAGQLTDPAHPSRNGLFRNRNGRFEDVTAGSGLEHSGFSQGVAVGDYNNDRFPDLYVTTYGGNHLYRNEKGSGRFTDVSEAAGVSDLDQGKRYSLSAAWGDYDRDGNLDLFVTHYAVWSPETDEPCVNALKKRGYCNPEKYQADRSRLYRNNGRGAFEDVSKATGIDRATGRAMGAVWLDYNGDGWQDLFVTCDLTPNLLFRNTGKGHFEEVALDANVAYGDMGIALSGMGVAAGDYDNDGRDDLHVTNFSHQPNSLFRNGGDGLFDNASVVSGVAEPSNSDLGWGCEFLDYDLDSLKDLIVANGHIQEEIHRLVPGLSYAQPKALYHNEGNGRFTRVTAGLGDLSAPTVARGLAVGDYDNDGRPDVLINNQNGPAQLLRNTPTSPNQWISFELEGASSPRDGQHARVTVRSGGRQQMRDCRTGGSFCSSSDPRVYFGLGSAATVEEVAIRWPGGKTVRTKGLAAGKVWRWKEGMAVPEAASEK